MTQSFHRFRAANFDDAYAMMRQALGDDAVVIRTTHVREGGVFGFLGRRLVELTASGPARRSAAASAPIRPLTAAERRYASGNASGNLATVPPPTPIGSDAAVTDSVAYFQQLITDAQKRMAAKNEKKPAKVDIDPDSPLIPFKRPTGEPSPADTLRREIGDLRRLVEVLVAEAPGANMPAEYAAQYKLIMDAGVSRKAAAELLASAIRDSDLAIIRNPRIFTERLTNEIHKRVRVTGGIGLSAGTCKKIAFVGSTGVGKTTNLAKLAAQFSVRQHAKVGMITADTYRVAAPEQLRVFANIIGLPMRVANDANEMNEALNGFSDCDIVLIDTAGGSQYNKGQLRELRDMLQAAAPHEIVLALAANTQCEDQQQIVNNFMPLKPTSLFFSKLDETRRYGSVYTVLAETGLPVSYFSTGQDVPNDIVLAQPEIVSDLVLRGRSERLGASHER